jgi:Las17-binding protein actin regulator
VSSILSSKVKLEADASVAGGPKGRDASADTDAWMRAEILSYSRSRGLFAGISLEGSTIRPDDETSELIYGRAIKARDIVRGEHTGVPGTGRNLVNVLQKNAPRNESASFEPVVATCWTARIFLIPATWRASEERHSGALRRALEGPSEKVTVIEATLPVWSLFFAPIRINLSVRLKTDGG